MTGLDNPVHSAKLGGMARKRKKWTVDELTRLAFIYGEQDRMAMAEGSKDDYGREQGELAEADRASAVRMESDGELDVARVSRGDVAP